MNKKEDIIKKWSSILEPVTGSKADWMSEYAKSHIDKESQRNNKIDKVLDDSTEFPILLPTAMKVAAKTIAMDLCFASEEEINEVKSKVQSENRDGKIKSIIEGGDFVEKKLEDDPEYKELMKKGVQPLSAPSGKLFYLDFKYDSDKVETHKKTRRSGKKHKKKSNDSI